MSDKINKIEPWDAIVEKSNAVKDKYEKFRLNEDFLLKMDQDFPIENKWATLFLPYNQQITNGGHQQYVDNNYHSSFHQHSYSSFDYKGDIHQKLLRYTENLKRKYKLNILDEFLQVLRNFKIDVNDSRLPIYSGDEKYGDTNEAREGLFCDLDDMYLGNNGKENTLCERLVDEVGKAFILDSQSLEDNPKPKKPKFKM